nr:MAG: major capsid protein [Microviridae sp.]
MAIKRTLGGERLGSGKKMKVELDGYVRSNHDLSYKWRSSMAAGTLVPFMCKVALPGDTWDISLMSEILTHPTLGPLFGEFKAQFDIFEIPMRLYHGALHNNKLGIGLHMDTIQFPQMKLTALPGTPDPTKPDYDNSQINPSSVFSYIGLRGVGANIPADGTAVIREFNGVPLVAYYDIVKNYYVNKMEEQAYMIYTNPAPVNETVNVDGVTIYNSATSSTTVIPQGTSATPILTINTAAEWGVGGTGAFVQGYDFVFHTSQGDLSLLAIGGLVDVIGSTYSWFGTWPIAKTGFIEIYGWDYLAVGAIPQSPPQLVTWDISAMDELREQILIETINDMPDAIVLNDLTTVGQNPLAYALTILNDSGTLYTPYQYTQHGLCVKTYQSDLLENWLNMDYIDDVGGINDITKIVTTSGSFTLDTLLLNRKIYDFLNRILVSGGSYKDWVQVTYDQEMYMMSEIPIYHGGMSKELAFQEVISNAQAASSQSGQPNQPLGTLAGRGRFRPHQKGGGVTIHVKEPGYIMGIVSLTPRLDYSQGNNWDLLLQSMDDLHKPALDQIGFQESMNEQRAWWSTYAPPLNPFVETSAGKLPAWINYMTSVNEVRGNFASINNEMFMVLTRRYQLQVVDNVTSIADLTTYIDPTHYNFIFAQTSLDAQNFWAQIAVNCFVRRKMSSKVMPNL